jgi:hypothetical protein
MAACADAALARWTRAAVSDEVRILTQNIEYLLFPVLVTGAAAGGVPAPAGMSITVAAALSHAGQNMSALTHFKETFQVEIFHRWLQSSNDLGARVLGFK